MSVNTENAKNNLATQQSGKPQQPNSLKQLLEAPAIKKRFEQLLDKRAPQFISSIVNLVSSDTNLAKCDPLTVIGSCMVAATLNLPIDKNLGYAWIVPYGNKSTMQIGYKGFIQLALRTGQYRYINVIEVYEGELVKFDRLTEHLEFDQEKRTSDAIVGYAAYFELLNGFKKTVYWSKEQIILHRDRFSKQANGKVWRDDFDAMAMKTVLKNMLSKWGILSIEMQQAVTGDDHEFTTTEDGSDVIDLTPGDFYEADTVSPNNLGDQGNIL